VNDPYPRDDIDSNFSLLCCSCIFPPASFCMVQFAPIGVSCTSMNSNLVQLELHVLHYTEIFVSYIDVEVFVVTTPLPKSPRKRYV
jgi:hypothetical protein